MVKTIDSADNFSDHLPLTFSINVPMLIPPPSVSSPKVSSPQSVPRVSWSKVTESNIREYNRVVAIPAILPS